MVANRQTGTSTALAKAAIDSDGYLIVGTLRIAKDLLKKHPGLKAERVLTVHQIRCGQWDFDPSPVFIDTTAVWGMK